MKRVASLATEVVDGEPHLVVREEDRDAVVELLASLLVDAYRQQDDLDGACRQTGRGDR